MAIYEFTAKVLGVTYRDGCINIKPYVKGRNFAKGKVATPVGDVYVDWTIYDGEFKINVKLPGKIRAALTVPDGQIIEVQSGVYNCKIRKELI